VPVPVLPPALESSSGVPAAPDAGFSAVPFVDGVAPLLLLLLLLLGVVSVGFTTTGGGQKRSE
jgi:hypothetical protein